MSWSLTEFETLCRKAARGAGLSWGLADEAGKAARWLCACDWPGAEALAAHLDACDLGDWRAMGPAALDGDWIATSGLLSPLVTGPALCDLAQDWAQGCIAQLGPVAHPLLLAPYMAWASGLTGTGLTLAWPGVRISWTKSQLWLDPEDPAALSIPRTDKATLGRADTVTGQAVTRRYRAEIPEPAKDILLRLAQRTYAPETEASKLAGAGAGLTDND